MWTKSFLKPLFKKILERLLRLAFLNRVTMFSELFLRVLVFKELSLITGTKYFNSFHATGIFQCPLKTSENQMFSDIFRGYRKRSVAWNGLMAINDLKSPIMENYNELRNFQELASDKKKENYSIHLRTLLFCYPQMQAFSPHSVKVSLTLP